MPRTFTETNENGGIKHTRSDNCLTRFDLTDFGTKRRFQRILRSFNLISGYKRHKYTVEGVGDHPDKQYFIYTWSNSKVVLITRNNPITGKFQRPKERKNDKGYASHITIRGECDEVRKLRNRIAKSATFTKGLPEGKTPKIKRVR